MKFRPDTSFPFLALAHRIGLPYGTVMQCVQRLDAKPRGLLTDLVAVEAAKEIIDVYVDEVYRRAMIFEARRRANQKNSRE